MQYSLTIFNTLISFNINSYKTIVFYKEFYKVAKRQNKRTFYYDNKQLLNKREFMFHIFVLKVFI